MRLSYLTASSIPSREANAVQVVKMAQAFRAAGNEVTLFARHGQEQTALSDHDYFDVGEDFEIVKHTWPGVPVVGGIAYASSVRRDVVSRTLPDLFYSRNPLTLASIVGVQRPMRLEVHALPEN